MGARAHSTLQDFEVWVMEMKSHDERFKKEWGAFMSDNFFCVTKLCAKKNLELNQQINYIVWDWNVVQSNQRKEHQPIYTTTPSKVFLKWDVLISMPLPNPMWMMRVLPFLCFGDLLHLYSFTSSSPTLLISIWHVHLFSPSFPWASLFVIEPFGSRLL